MYYFKSLQVEMKPETLVASGYAVDILDNGWKMSAAFNKVSR